MDFVTVNAYLGLDGVEPFRKASAVRGGGIFALVKTSNPSGVQLQDLKIGERTVYEVMGDLVSEWGKDCIGEHGYSSIGAVVGATYPEQGAALLPAPAPTPSSSWPGYGAQGATGKDLRAASTRRAVARWSTPPARSWTAWRKQPGVDIAQAAYNEAVRHAGGHHGGHPRMKRLTAKVLSCAELNAEMGLLALALPAGAEAAVPGQFAHIAVPGDRAHLLRRPISLYSVHDGILELGIAAKGEGTRRILAAKPGEEIDLLYPLGRGFERAAWSASPLWAGASASRPCALRWRPLRTPAAARSSGSAAGTCSTPVEACERTGAPVTVCTDDGSAGVHGLVTGPLEEMLRRGEVDGVMACGPTPMLRAVQALALQYGVPAQLSLEEHMGCGIGACLTCNCKVKAKDGEFAISASARMARCSRQRRSCSDEDGREPVRGWS